MTVLVTGASRGLGRSVALSLAAEGRRVVGIARDSNDLEQLEKELSAFRTDNEVKSCDLTKKTQILELLNGIHGEIDGVVHNLGGTIETINNLMSTEDIINALQLNLFPAIEINNQLINQFRKRRSGYLVHISSLASLENSGSNSYSVAKAALNAYVRNLGKNLIQEGISVTAILPGRLSKSTVETSHDLDSSDYFQAVTKLVSFLSTGNLALAGSVILADGGFGNVIPEPGC
jgi:3-oxoacyl-[acyl-carrier protein] reductase